MISLPVFAFTGRMVFILKTEGIILPTGLATDCKFAAFQHPYVFRRFFHGAGKSSHTMQCVTNSRGLSLNHMGTLLLYSR